MACQDAPKVSNETLTRKLSRTKPVKISLISYLSDRAIAAARKGIPSPKTEDHRFWRRVGTECRGDEDVLHFQMEILIDENIISVSGEAQKDIINIFQRLADPEDRRVVRVELTGVEVCKFVKL